MALQAAGSCQQIDVLPGAACWWGRGGSISHCPRSRATAPGWTSSSIDIHSSINISGPLHDQEGLTCSKSSRKYGAMSIMAAENTACKLSSSVIVIPPPRAPTRQQQKAGGPVQCSFIGLPGSGLCHTQMRQSGTCAREDWGVLAPRLPGGRSYSCCGKARQCDLEHSCGRSLPDANDYNQIDLAHGLCWRN